MRIIETPVFTKQINRLLDEDTYKQFKEYLVCNPLKGKLIKGGGGIRKIRWSKKNTGKSREHYKKTNKYVGKFY